MIRPIVAVSLVAALIAGCISRPPLTEDRAVHCVRQTFEFQNRTRGIGHPVRLISESEEDEIIVSVFEEGPDAYHRLATFRILKNRRIDVWDMDKDDWRTVAVCD